MKEPSLSISRYVPHRAFPSYAFVPGQSPHPTHNPEGHSYNHIPEEIEAPDPARWADNEHYLFGIDLFNHGYYWEAHEIWEDLWNADGRIGLTADFLKGLIKLAAAGVKIRENVPHGVRIHARGAGTLFEAIQKELGADTNHYMGLSLQELLDFSQALAWCSSELPSLEDSKQVVFDFCLKPMGEDST